MANIIFKIIAFSIMLNFSIGLMDLAIPGFTVLGSGAGSGLTYQEGYTTDFEGNLEGDTNPGGTVQEGSGLDRVFDSVGLSYIIKVKDAFKVALYGFPIMLESIFGKYLGDSLGSFLFGAIYTILSIMYLIGIISLFTATDVTK